jgi:hypothetical protein
MASGESGLRTQARRDLERLARKLSSQAAVLRLKLGESLASRLSDRSVGDVPWSGEVRGSVFGFDAAFVAAKDHVRDPPPNYLGSWVRAPAPARRAILLEFFNCPFDLVVGERTRGPDPKRNRILLAQRFDFDGKPHRRAEVMSGGNHAVVGEQRAGASAQRFQYRPRQFLGAIRRVGRATDRRPAGGGNHIMHGRYLHAANREGRGMNRVRVDDRVDVHALLQNIAMDTPFRGGREPVLIVPVHVHEDDIVNFQFVVRQARRRDQQAIFPTHRNIAGGPLIDAVSVHAETGADDRLADSFFLGRGHTPALSKAAAKTARAPRELFDLGEILRRDKPRRDHR